MLASKFTTPVLVVAFNRPDLTKRVIERVLELKPKTLYLALDGPRAGNKADQQKCREVREMAEKLCKGKCELRGLYQKRNYGCKFGPYKAIDWFFSKEKRGIILEDDVLADRSFFYFCQELLEKYQDDERIAGISGNNFQFGRKRTSNSYYFSRFSHTSGWATWRRAWQKYDIEIKQWPLLKKGSWLKDILPDQRSVRYWTLIFNRIFANKIKTAWDYQWTFMCWTQHMVSILPNQNLVSNIGFGDPDATHTKSLSKFANLKAEPMHFPLKHPELVIADTQADNRTQRQNYVLWKELGVAFLDKVRRK